MTTFSTFGQLLSHLIKSNNTASNTDLARAMGKLNKDGSPNHTHITRLLKSKTGPRSREDLLAINRYFGVKVIEMDGQFTYTSDSAAYKIPEGVSSQVNEKTGSYERSISKETDQAMNRIINGFSQIFEQEIANASPTARGELQRIAWELAQKIGEIRASKAQ